jgi:DNA-binding NarL/FixJ family response regulator
MQDRPESAVGGDPVRVFLVEDRRGALRPLADFLGRQPGIVIAGTYESGLLACVRALFDHPHVILVAADLVGFTALDTVRLLKQMSPAAKILLLGRTEASIRWLRKAERPDGMVERASPFPEVVDWIRSARNETSAATCPAAAQQPTPTPPYGTRDRDQ